MAVIISDSANTKYGTGVATVAVASGGTGYAVSDVLTLSSGDGNATCTVLTVAPVTGAVLTVSRTTVGSGYSAGTSNTTVAPAGGTGCTITVTVQAGLGTVNGFYRVEAYNLGVGSAIYTTNGIDLATETFIPLTFANAGNCQGTVVALWVTSTCDRSVVVKLQHNAGGWSDVAGATKTLTTSQVTNAITKKTGGWIRAFKFGTPAAVTTDASTWRLSVSQTGGTAGSFYLLTSATTSPMYACWCDNTVSFTNNDSLVVADAIIIDKTATVQGLLGTGMTARSCAITICASNDPTPDNVSLLTWENPAVASYTLTVDGCIYFGAHSGFRIGTSTNKIAVANSANLTFTTAASGSFSGMAMVCGYNNKNASFFAYGATSTVYRTTLAADANASQNQIVTTDTTGWSINDHVWIGKATDKTVTTEVYNSRTISNISGTTITLSSNLTKARKAGGLVLRSEGFGVNITGINSSNYFELYSPSNFVNYGTKLYNVAWRIGELTAISSVTDDTANTSQYLISNNFFNNPTVAEGPYIYLAIPPKGILMEKNSGVACSMVGDLNSCISESAGGSISGRLTFNDNWVVYLLIGTFTRNPLTLSSLAVYSNFDVDGLVIQHGAVNLPGIAFFGVGNTIKNSSFWSHYGVYGAINCFTSVNGEFENNTFDFCSGGVYFQAYPSINLTDIGSTFGAESANDMDVSYAQGAYIDYIVDDSDSNISVYTTGLSFVTEGTRIRIVDYGGTPGDNRSWLRKGYFRSTGTGLADTTVHTSGTGKFALRFEPISSTENLEWVQTIPTGNIQNKTMTVAVWCKINNAAYYAGTHQLPRLTVNFDNGTTSYDEHDADTDWQLLKVTFTSTTTYGAITATLSGRTDATTTNAYIYWDDWSILYPASVALDLGGMDNWADALPVTPTIAIPISAYTVSNAVWEELLSSHTTASTFGKHVGNKLLTVAKFLGLR